ncbi:hypothetical protein BJ165DRAFT_1501245 [Panaeolus papilionaceus]|nr:hypothetical protein BJ165DRAFT_1501245 [Panaeolus papilionaceus]
MMTDICGDITKARPPGNQWNFLIKHKKSILHISCNKCAIYRLAARSQTLVQCDVRGRPCEGQVVCSECQCPSCPRLSHQKCVLRTCISGGGLHCCGQSNNESWTWARLR